MASACTNGLDTGFIELGYAKVAALGVVQGITELLPISSTAHMRIVPALLGWRDPGSAFSAAMQAAALVAVITYFWSDVRGMVFGSIGAVIRRDFRDWNFRFAMWIVLASLPIVISGLLMSPLLNACNTPLRSLPVIGISMITLAIILAIAEIYCDHSRKFDQITLKDAMIVGIAQCGALIPGVSRSGSTLTAALFRDLNREDAARFSFLLGLPAIAGAGLKEFHELYKAHLDLHGWSILAVGLIVASISAFAAIWGLLRILEKFSAWPFVIYRALIGVFLLVGAYVGFLH
ncbi:MAG TPA: undecaprenyl-diphosphatase UppP [Beijerinckiaceae bacterium]|nr:undecaprenyl-diphosphatase UppP [Rhodoblastus sp.]MCB9997724.1 undecaprenyl-diphosphatase UppP [Methylobacteriaceae bacterium]MCC2099614.1 undecaprenyl-diphosphatase UppP [Hyphomicrobiales bacterium]HRY04729.1 undecaprenyl-diphosphatase UppP [Beijerinckiaceae bacterium]MCB1523048.1 undecaprenyl-diphosphatase UppP [Rhodoblastus sp.]